MLHMTVFKLKQELTLGEYLGWCKYFRAKMGQTLKDEEPSAEDIVKALGAKPPKKVR